MRRKGLGAAGWITLGLGLTFLYLPILVVVAYSFNAGRLAAVWGGFSLRWYASLTGNTQMLDSLGVSLGAAFLSASAATALGTAAALGLARGARRRGRSLFTASIYAPLVTPDVLLGLSLLLLFVAIGLDRGFWTVVAAHTTLSLSYVAVVVRARLSSVQTSLEEAAQDLGAGPGLAFWTVTLPLITPAIAAGWLLAFSLSLDDLVIASFTSGPGATTLPMRLYSQVRLGVTPEINAISTLLIVLAALTATVYAAVLYRRRPSAP